MFKDDCGLAFRIGLELLDGIETPVKAAKQILGHIALVIASAKQSEENSRPKSMIRYALRDELQPCTQAKST
jgi:hypothetical protein